MDKKLYLARYDTQHIRIFYNHQNSLKFSHNEDSLLSLAPYLFAQSAQCKIHSSHLNKLNHLNKALQVPPIKLTITSRENYLTISLDNQTYHLSSKRIDYWSSMFQEQTLLFTTAEQFQLPHRGKELLQEFFAEIGLTTPLGLSVLEVYYPEDFFFIPFEFCYHQYLVKIFLSSSNNPQPNTSLSSSVVFDPLLPLAKEESIHVLSLLDKRSFRKDNQNPALLLVSAHGLIDNDCSALQNKTLEEIVRDKSPNVLIFNSCLLAQKPHGIIDHFIQQGSIVIASPFYTLNNKTIFAPLLRFIYSLDPHDLWMSFIMLKVFYPHIASYFRYYIPTRFSK